MDASPLAKVRSPATLTSEPTTNFHTFHASFHSQAHSLASHASSLLKSSSLPSHSPSIDVLVDAAKTYNEAADLFDEARGKASDAGAATTLQLLATQNRKQARLLDRRISTTRKSSLPPPTSTTSGVDVTSDGNAQGTERKRDPSNGTERRRRRPGSVSSTSPISRHRSSIPPFATAPAPSASHSQPLTGAASTISTQSTSYGSSSSSSRGEDSFVIFGSSLDTSDPFARFWNVLETALHDITNPVAFASAPLEVPSRATTGVPAAAGAERKGKSKDKEKERKERGGDEKERAKEHEKEKEKKNQEVDLISSGTESFYLVSRDSGRVRVQPQVNEDSPNGSANTITAIPKTPEELSLENTSLRASLDAISRHAQRLENEVKRLKERDEKKGEMMRSVVMGVRREAQKAVQSQEIYRSQLLQASQLTAHSPNNRQGTMRGLPMMSDAGKGKDKSQDESMARISELEGQVKVLQMENDKQRAHLQKYRDRFEKLKLSSRNKREAKITTPPPLAVVGEEEGGEG